MKPKILNIFMTGITKSWNFKYFLLLLKTDSRALMKLFCSIITFEILCQFFFPRPYTKKIFVEWRGSVVNVFLYNYIFQLFVVTERKKSSNLMDWNKYITYSTVKIFSRKLKSVKNLFTFDNLWKIRHKFSKQQFIKLVLFFLPWLVDIVEQLFILY